MCAVVLLVRSEIARWRLVRLSSRNVCMHVFVKHVHAPRCVSFLRCGFRLHSAHIWTEHGRMVQHTVAALHATLR